jgi:hypothetical protein
VGTETMRDAPRPSREVIKEAKRAVEVAEAAYRRKLAAARDVASRAERAYNSAVAEARREVHAAESAQEKAVRTAAARLEEARRGRRLAAYGQVALFENALVAPDGSVPLSREIRASVETSGVKTDKVDNRELVLMLDTPRFDSVIPLNPNDTIAVRQLAAAINTARRSSRQRSPSRTTN